MNIHTGSVCATLLVLIQGCKIVQSVSSGGFVLSGSGNHDCPESRTCEVDVPNGEPFRETFTAIPRYDYQFAGWRGTESYLCAGSEPTCTVDIPASVTAYDATGRITAEFYHQPQLVHPGTVAMEFGAWSGEVELDAVSYLYAGDFDADGDDDVLIGAATHAPGPYTGIAQTGVILVNEGGYSFTVADGDRPSNVHPREVVMADFNADGMNDFFIADHGYDDDPFPGWSNQLLLWTSEGFDDVSDRLPEDPTGFTHSAAAGDVDGDGDIDILVGNKAGDFMGGGHYFLLNDGDAQFTVNTSYLPDRVESDEIYRAWTVDIADLDADGHADLIMGGDTGTGESFVYWGAQDGEFRDESVTVLQPPEFFLGPDGGHFPIATAIHDIDGDGLPDVLLGSYDGPPDWRRGLQILINAGNRAFMDETRRRLGNSAWSPHETWHPGYRFLDFNGDGTLDIVPEGFSSEPSNVLAWLNDGTGHYVALKSTLFTDSDAVNTLSWGVKIREGSQFKTLNFFPVQDEMLGANAGVFLTSPVITLAN